MFSLQPPRYIPTLPNSAVTGVCPAWQLSGDKPLSTPVGSTAEFDPFRTSPLSCAPSSQKRAGQAGPCRYVKDRTLQESFYPLSWFIWLRDRQGNVWATAERPDVQTISRVLRRSLGTVLAKNRKRNLGRGRRWSAYAVVVSDRTP